MTKIKQIKKVLDHKDNVRLDMLMNIEPELCQEKIAIHTKIDFFGHANVSQQFKHYLRSRF